MVSVWDVGNDTLSRRIYGMAQVCSRVRWAICALPRFMCAHAHAHAHALCGRQTPHPKNPIDTEFPKPNRYGVSKTQ